MSDLDLAVYGAIDREQTGQQVHDAVESGRQGLVRHKPELEHADERTPVGAEQRQAGEKGGHNGRQVHDAHAEHAVDHVRVDAEEERHLERDHEHASDDVVDGVDEQVASNAIALLWVLQCVQYSVIQRLCRIGGR